MPSQGPLSPGAIVNDAGAGSVAWTTPSNAAAQDDVYAQSSSLGFLATTQYLQATDFGFTLPALTQIDGVLVEYDVHASGSAVEDQEVRLVKDGTVQGANRATTDDYPTSDTDVYQSRGGAADLWALSLSPDHVNASTFGVVLRAANKSLGSRDVRCDHVRLTVFYTVLLPTRYRLLTGVG